MAEVTRVHRTLQLRGATGSLRTASFRSKEHTVVPVVALVEGVVHAVNAERPELVRAATLKKLPVAWNNRPICGGHPFEGGTQVSANDPHILEKYQFGFIANADVPDDRLVLEAWIDRGLIRSGTVAERAMRRIDAGEPTEVSVGAYITLEEKEGTFKGRRYYAEWVDVVPDHLAFLDDDETGACSMQDGCGTLRSNSRGIYLVTAAGLEPVKEEVAMNKCAKCGKEYEGDAHECPPAAATPPEPLSLRQRVIFETASSEDLTSSDLSQGLDRALRAIEPGYQGVLDILLNQKKVVYVVAPEDTWKLLQRSYTDDEGNISVADDVEEVRMVNRYEPVAAESRAATSRAACSCHNSNKESHMNREERIAALITKGTYKEADKTWLSAMPDAAFDTLAKSHEEPPAQTPPAPAPAAQPTAAAAGQPTVQTAEQFFSMVGDPQLRESLEDGYRASQERRTATIAALKATGRCKYSDEELNAMSTKSLEKLAELASVPAPSVLNANFGGRGIPPSGKKNSETIDEPPSLIAALQAKGKKQTA